MSDTVIKVENLGKKYLLSHRQDGQSQYRALRDVIADGARSVGKRLINPFRQSSLHPEQEEFWALKDVSFEIKRGDRVGVIGRNGAGKSTLLKILSRITEPTTGRISIRGRVASLLEVGTGFHPELTGRENIFLNGAVLGMGKTEIERKFDEIVTFAEVEKFLDTPVKRYSSGMYVRLAFAVAAHLDPEIMIVDEVLAVGDAQFQKKCLGKMENVARKDGKTILFVSHNLNAIQNLCENCIYIVDGNIEKYGKTDETLEKYLSDNLNKTGDFESLLRSESLNRSGSGIIRIVDFQISNLKGNVTETLQSGEDYIFHFIYEVKDGINVDNVIFSFGVTDKMGNLLFRNCTQETKTNLDGLTKNGKISCVVPKIPLSTGIYQIGFRIVVNHEEADYVRARDSMISFDIDRGDFYGTGLQSNHAPLLVEHSWIYN